KRTAPIRPLETSQKKVSLARSLSVCESNGRDFMARRVWVLLTVLLITFSTAQQLNGQNLSAGPSRLVEHVSWTGVNASRSRSVQQIFSGDGSVEFRVASPGAVVGLTHGSSANIDFALSINPGSYLAVSENGVR